MMSMKKMPGFMCQSPADTAVCMSADTRSVIIPNKRPHHVRSTSDLIDDTTRFVSTAAAKYSRINNHVERSLSESKSISVPSSSKNNELLKTMPALRRSATVANASDHGFQVVVLRVSLHCQGCAGKVKKHLSKMEGVTSFSIDLQEKRVTVIGNISPDVVVESVSKVKRAQLWR